MSSLPLADVRNARLKKVAELRALGIDPYPARSARSDYAGPLVGDFERHEGRRVTVAGRLMSYRKHGALSFGHLQDQTGRIQLYLRRDALRATDPAAGTLGYAELHLWDVGDLVEATGTVTRTERGEISILAETVRILAKSLRPLPDKWAGVKDRETVLRRRYLDTIMEPEARQPFEVVGRILYAIRRFLDERGFLEFQTPVIQAQYGGGSAKPFMTHVNALDCDMYLAISHELYLKRLIVAGYDRVYTIGRYFRNEGIDRAHHPEFSMVETMTAYEDYEYNMDLIEELFRHVAQEVFGRTEFTVRGHAVDFGKPWARVSMADAVLRATGIDFRACGSLEEANAHLARLGIATSEPSIGDALVSAFEERAAPDLVAPTLVTGHPVEISPLAKPMAADPRYVERFEIFIAGMECGDNWTEQNDPQQLLRFWQRSRDLAARTGDVPPIDYDFVEAIEHGMPPTTGIGPGVERMAMIFTGNENIDEVIFFPMMKPLLSPVNRALYGVAEPQAAVAVETGDVLLTAAEFAALLADGLLRPETGALAVRPDLRLWQAPGDPNAALKGARPLPWKVTGQLEVAGFFRAALKGARALQVAGYVSSGEGRCDLKAEARRLRDWARATLLDPLRARFPDLQAALQEPEE